MVGVVISSHNLYCSLWSIYTNHKFPAATATGVPYDHEVKSTVPCIDDTVLRGYETTGYIRVKFAHVHACHDARQGYRWNFLKQDILSVSYPLPYHLW